MCSKTWGTSRAAWYDFWTSGSLKVAGSSVYGRLGSGLAGRTSRFLSEAGRVLGSTVAGAAVEAVGEPDEPLLPPDRYQAEAIPAITSNAKKPWISRFDLRRVLLFEGVDLVICKV